MVVVDSDRLGLGGGQQKALGGGGRWEEGEGSNYGR